MKTYYSIVICLSYISILGSNYYSFKYLPANKNSSAVSSIAISPNERFVSYSKDNFITVRDLHTDKRIAKFRTDEPIRSLTMSNNMIVSQSKDNYVEIWNFANETQDTLNNSISKKTRIFHHNPQGKIDAFGIPFKTNNVMIAYDDKLLARWQPGKTLEVKEHKQEQEMLRIKMNLVAQNTYIFHSCTPDKPTSQWPTLQRNLNFIKKNFKEDETLAAWHETYAASIKKRNITLWRILALTSKFDLTASNDIKTIALSHTNRTIAAGLANGEIEVWRTPKPLTLTRTKTSLNLAKMYQTSTSLASFSSTTQTVNESIT